MLWSASTLHWPQLWLYVALVVSLFSTTTCDELDQLRKKGIHAVPHDFVLFENQTDVSQVCVPVFIDVSEFLSTPDITRDVMIGTNGKCTEEISEQMNNVVEIYVKDFRAELDHLCSGFTQETCSGSRQKRFDPLGYGLHAGSYALHYYHYHRLNNVEESLLENWNHTRFLAVTMEKRLREGSCSVMLLAYRQDVQAEFQRVKRDVHTLFEDSVVNKRLLNRTEIGTYYGLENETANQDFIETTLATASLRRPKCRLQGGVLEFDLCFKKIEKKNVYRSYEITDRGQFVSLTPNTARVVRAQLPRYVAISQFDGSIRPFNPVICKEEGMNVLVCPAAAMKAVGPDHVDACQLPKLERCTLESAPVTRAKPYVTAFRGSYIVAAIQKNLSIICDDPTRDHEMAIQGVTMVDVATNCRMKIGNMTYPGHAPLTMHIRPMISEVNRFPDHFFMSEADSKMADEIHTYVVRSSSEIVKLDNEIKSNLIKDFIKSVKNLADMIQEYIGYVILFVILIVVIAGLCWCLCCCCKKKLLCCCCD